MSYQLKDQYITLKPEMRLHQCPLPIIGLTGGIATGKSTVSDFLKAKGFKIICADALIKSIYQKGHTIGFITKNYPVAITEGQINFKKLRELAFSDQSIRENLENYLYQFLPKEFLNAIDSTDKVIIYDVPLLFEKNLDSLVDYSLVVYTNKEVQTSRLLSRDNIDLELANKIIKNQIDLEIKKEKAHYTVSNNENLQALEESINSWVETCFIT